MTENQIKGDENSKEVPGPTPPETNSVLPQDIVSKVNSGEMKLTDALEEMQKENPGPSKSSADFELEDNEEEKFEGPIECEHGSVFSVKHDPEDKDGLYFGFLVKYKAGGEKTFKYHSNERANVKRTDVINSLNQTAL